MTLAVAVLSKNSSHTLAKTIESVLFCDEVIVIDDFSTDSTAAIVRQYETKVKVYRHSLSNDFSQQRNFTLTKTSSEWVLFLDSDEYLSPALKKELRNWLKQTHRPNVGAYKIKRKDFFLGKKLKFGETGSIKLLRLVKKGSGRWQKTVHEEYILNPGVKSGFFHHPIYHNHQFTDLSSFIDKINWYTTLVAKENANKNKNTVLAEMFTFPAAKFIWNYFFKLGWADGMPGLILAYCMSLHSFLVRLKIKEMKQ